jgi:hypothetical protein
VIQTSAQRKFLWGVEHAARLLREANDYVGRDAYVFRAEVVSKSAHEIRFRGIAEEREAPPNYWPLLAGDAIQNLRSALDHVVYAAASGGNERTQFPIFTDPNRYKEQNPNWLKGVPDSVKTTIENAQPYRRYPTNPAVSGLEQLRDLSNRDKHRTLTTVASAVQHEGVGVSESVNITWEKPATGSPLGSGKTHVSTFTARSEAEISEADIEPLFTYEVLIEGWRVDMFRAIVREAWPVLVECETRETFAPSRPVPPALNSLRYRLGHRLPKRAAAAMAGRAVVVARLVAVAQLRWPGVPHIDRGGQRVLIAPVRELVFEIVAVGQLDVLGRDDLAVRVAGDQDQVAAR